MIDRIRKLYDYLHSRKGYRSEIVRLGGSGIYTFLYTENEKKRDFTSTNLTENDNGHLILTLEAWDESYHNGDSYNSTSRTLNIQSRELFLENESFGNKIWGQNDTDDLYDKILTMIHEYLDEEALEEVEKEIEEADAEKKKHRIMRFLYYRLGEKNIPAAVILEQYMGEK